MTELELKEKIYRTKSSGTKAIANPRTVTTEKVSSANIIITNLMNYILAKHS